MSTNNASVENSTRSSKGLVVIFIGPGSILLSYILVLLLMGGMATHERYLIPSGYSGPQPLLVMPCEAMPARVALLEQEEAMLVQDLRRMLKRDRTLVITAFVSSGVTLFWLSRDRKNAPLESSIITVRSQLHAIDTEMKLRCS